MNDQDQTGPPEPTQPEPLSRRERPTRRAVLGAAAIGGITAVGAGACAWAGGWLPSDRLTPAKFADRFEQLSGVHDGFRRNHAKGVSASGTFVSNGAGVELSSAAVFASGSTPVTARFSLSGGLPTVADANATTRGFAVLFHLNNGEQWRTAMVNLPVFLDSVPRGFYDRVLATAPVPATGQPDPAKVAAFLAAYPETARAMALVKKTPPASDFSNSTFRGLNAFYFTNRAGKSIPVRWSVVPEDAFRPGSKDPRTDHDYLFNALIERVRSGPVRWRLMITLGAPGDPTHDATLPWPANRPRIDVGTLTIDALQTEEAGNARDVNFDPLILPQGISPSDDPLLNARSAVYAKSYRRRTREAHQPSKVDVQEVEATHDH
ncbi:catalase family peroxidase [Streptomyces sp. NPDC059152]|uniref:catalase family peroxidase n=1 Tax=Streptomyces sp. NPDC059152 TaxID=3346742 RepID=UPI0036935ACD